MADDVIVLSSEEEGDLEEGDLEERDPEERDPEEDCLVSRIL